MDFQAIIAKALQEARVVIEGSKFVVYNEKDEWTAPHDLSTFTSSWTPTVMKDGDYIVLDYKADTENLRLPDSYKMLAIAYIIAAMHENGFRYVPYHDARNEGYGAYAYHLGNSFEFAII
ncbi:hypothetical protein RCMENCHIE_131 [Rhodobacter phage RcMenchie]|nr:hypothetical protein RCMENCHIE_131 [Rhodobacter phage RcMenchie]